MSENTFVGLICFAGGALVTAFGYTILLTSKLSSLTTRFEDHLKSGGTCVFHNTVTTDAAVARAKAEELDKRVNKLDEATD